MPGCSRLRKDSCINDDACVWVVGSGCRAAASSSKTRTAKKTSTNKTKKPSNSKTAAAAATTATASTSTPKKPSPPTPSPRKPQTSRNSNASKNSNASTPTAKTKYEKALVLLAKEGVPLLSPVLGTLFELDIDQANGLPMVRLAMYCQTRSNIELSVQTYDPTDNPSVRTLFVRNFSSKVALSSFLESVRVGPGENRVDPIRLSENAHILVWAMQRMDQPRANARLLIEDIEKERPAESQLLLTKLKAVLALKR
jgi:hypothetical protein